MTNNANDRARRRRGSTVTRLVGVCLVAGLLVAGVAFPVVGGLGVVANEASTTADAASSDLVTGRPPQVTTLTDNRGAPIAVLYDQYRTPVRLDEMSTAMRGAIVAIEDRRFYDHDGVDPTGTLRALARNQSAGGTEQGASTLTQQYVKNFGLHVEARTAAEQLEATQPTYARKLREIRAAITLERRLGAATDKRAAKDAVLERYLNLVFLGNGAYGVGAAARTYFGTTPDRLTVPQAALLAGMVQSTAQFDPTQHPRAATDRRNEVIRQMLAQSMISPAQAQEATAAPLGVVAPLVAPPNGCLGAGDGAQRSSTIQTGDAAQRSSTIGAGDGAQRSSTIEAGNAAFFCAYVQDYLARSGLSPEQLRRGGYTVRTTLDRAHLDAMSSAILSEVPARAPNVADVMATVAPGRDRHRVTAMGSNRVYGVDADARQTSYGLPVEPVNLGAGSVYKIFTAAAALDRGLGIEHRMPIPPDGYASPIYRDGSGRPFPVRNAGRYEPVLSMRDALAQSPNTGFVKLMEDTGVAPVVDMAVGLGLRSLAEPQGAGRRSIAGTAKAQNQGSFTLGVTPTSALELANVGATLASSGTWCPPTPVESVTDATGAPVPIPEAPCEQAVPPSLADTLLTGLSADDQPGGTSADAARSTGWTRPVAGKTGTTQQNRSAAFLGVTPQLSGAAIAFDDSSSPRPLCDAGRGAPPFPCAEGTLFGGKTPALTWYKTMNAALAGQPVAPLPPTDPRYVTGGRDVRVPDVVLQPVETAEARLADTGLRARRVPVDSRAPAGTVLAAEPRGSSPPDRTVTLRISSGTVPAAPPPPSSLPAGSLAPTTLGGAGSGG